jgi:hypothetical protein
MTVLRNLFHLHGGSVMWFIFRQPSLRRMMEMVQAILLPLFAQVALTFVMLGLTAYARTASVMRRETRIKDIALRQPNWPEQVTKFGNSFENQFQLPVLFYVVVILALIRGEADRVLVILSWVFVATRLCHAAIHVTSNHVGQRFYAFAAGFFVLVAMWAVFAVRTLAVLP